jgi:prepilin-type N-terminal cleavage/methylation domain-containing protein
VNFSFPHGTWGSFEERFAGARGRLRRGLRQEGGFTFIELLVVCLIIGVLAAIAVPSFASQKAKATNAEAKVLARTAQTAAETIAAHAYVSAATGTSTEYSLTAKATDGDEFKISRSAAGGVTRGCVSPVTKTGCAGGEKASW